jgi:hypothetical protein
MLDEATAKELIVDPVKRDLVLGGAGHRYVAPDPNGKLHTSLKGWWWVAE